MKTYLYALFICMVYFIPVQLSAQQTLKISGTVRDDKQTLPAATVLLYAAKDSSLISTAMTDDSGKFSISAIPGSYYILSTSVGYNKVKTAIFELKGNAPYLLPFITLRENSKQLNEVNITAAKPVLERKADKLIFNIEATPSAAGLNALELMRKAPGVTVDYNENISLAGKSNVLVTIDGKQTYLSGEEVSNLLKSMQSSEIESIEIINNPGSRYEANSTGGIINIKTKKSKTEGFNGNLSLSGGFNRHLLTGNAVNLNYRKKAFNLFGSYGFNAQKYGQTLTINRVTASAGKPLYVNQRTIDTSKNVSHNFKLGSDFFLSKNHTLGFLVKGNLYKRDQVSHSRISIGDAVNVPDSILITPSSNTNDRRNFSYNLNYKGVLDTAGQELTIDADYSTYNAESNAQYVNTFYRPDGDYLRNGQIYRNFAPSAIKIKAIKADYTLPFSKKVRLDAGVKIADVKSDNNYVYENEINSAWVYDNTKSNRFEYDERVNAAYATLNLNLNQTNIQAGLRTEQTHSTGTSVTTGEETVRKYTNLFPSLMISRTLDQSNTLSFTYSRKINRPNYQNLNPFIFYLDQYTYNQGNPKLNPEYSNSVEFSYLYKQKYSAALAYSHTTDVITEVLLQNLARQSMYQTVLNLASREVISLTLNFPVTIIKWWTMNNNVMGYYNQIKAPDLNGTNLNSKQFSANLYAQNNFTITTLFSADASAFFSTPQIEGAFHMKTMVTADAGLRYNFPNKLGNLKLGVSDIFHSQKARIYSNLPGNIYNLEQYGLSTSVRLTFTCRFGKMTVKSARNRSTGLDDEQKRLGGGR
jgi:outer membrane receptor protein involved in Fe transport